MNTSTMMITQHQKKHTTLTVKIETVCCVLYSEIIWQYNRNLESKQQQTTQSNHKNK